MKMKMAMIRMQLSYSHIPEIKKQFNEYPGSKKKQVLKKTIQFFVVDLLFPTEVV
jgi:hypothetical protein